MKIINIKDFGPIDVVTLDLDKSMQVFIGPQASGKSTVSKVVYFCRKIRDYTLAFLMDDNQFYYNNPSDYYSNYMKFLTKQFMGCFGTTKHMQPFTIEYHINDETVIHINLAEGYVKFHFSKFLNKEINDIVQFAAKAREQTSVFEKYSTIDTVYNQLRIRLRTLFEDDADIIYIPAGRSILSSMSDQLNDVPIAYMDLTMQEFMKLTRTAKTSFGTGLKGVVERYTKTVTGQIQNDTVEKATNLIHSILKADYVSDIDGEKMYIDTQKWVKLMYSSSGQQESLWILMLVFLAILEKNKTFMVIEEPEAHLFPEAQKSIVELIALMMNSTKSQILITTHSPYVLTSLNLLLYSSGVESNKNTESDIVNRQLRIDPQKFNAFKIDVSGKTHKLCTIFDTASGMIDTEYIDTVSSITNESLEQLINLDVRK